MTKFAIKLKIKILQFLSLLLQNISKTSIASPLSAFLQIYTNENNFEPIPKWEFDLIGKKIPSLSRID